MKIKKPLNLKILGEGWLIFFFEETNPGVFVKNPKFGIKNNFWVPEEYKKINEFCFRVRDNVAEFFESKNILKKQNLSKQEFSALNVLFDKKNDKFIINDSDKNLGAAAAEKKTSLKNAIDNYIT